ncbi:MAG: hypothetical protein M1818_007070 [Claussenomyces sp. TS43310]|nr:MAG: hypothetical protein M1818_007070 [Claussenomyces sp. TS43310]
MASSSVSFPSLLESVFNHVVLPPQLPGRREPKIRLVESALADRLLSATRTLRDLSKNNIHDRLDYICQALDVCKTVNNGGKVDKASLLIEFWGLKPKGLLILHIAEQNAALLIRKHREWLTSPRNISEQGENVVFEAFEASPLSEKVLASENALEWDFPGRAVTVPLSTFDNSSFQTQLATFLQQASAESIKRFAAHTYKAGSFAFESRHTVDPSLVTQMLMTLLEVNGRRIEPVVTHKHVRDDVCWSDGAVEPWRRCAFWLVLRVGVQRHLCTLLGHDMGRVYYKFIICLLLAHLLDDSLLHLNPEMLTILKAKLCRRLAKLEIEKTNASAVMRPVYEAVFVALGPVFHRSTRHAIEHINSAWTQFKTSIQKPIPFLPRSANQQDLYLTLPNSENYLQELLTQPLDRYNRQLPFTPYQLPKDFNNSAAATEQFRAFANRYFSLSEIETNIRNANVGELAAGNSCEARCLKIAGEIDAYLKAMAGAYDSNPEQGSNMILTVMELWMLMDQCTTKLFGLLKDYTTSFPAEILDVLQIPHLQDMRRLQVIQEYLLARNSASNCSSMTIFNDPVRGCFAERYFDQSQDSSEMQEVLQRVEQMVERAHISKKEEWQRLSTEHEELIRRFRESTCLFTTDEFQPLRRIHDDRKCTKCFLERQAKRMRIQVYEHPLPSDPVHTKAVIFELCCPKAFAAYRDVTWRILYTLAIPGEMEHRPLRLLLHKYDPLRDFQNPTTCRLSLASTTKSFLSTHYANVGLPVSLDQVYLPSGLNFTYFDETSNAWPSRMVQRPTFAHHCKMMIPTSSPLSFLQSLPAFAVDANGPSSYDVVASQSRCPPGLNVHEFMAYQSLFSGKRRRWLSMLVELGSSNLNFSTEATGLLMSKLALQAGPAHTADVLREAHIVFRDQAFCDRLVEQLHQRLDAISSNWRETNCMEMLVTLIIRLHSLASEPTAISEALKLLERVRDITSKWMNSLRAEVETSTDAATCKNNSRYALWTALLCRRTFIIYAEGKAILDPIALRCFIESSITLQDNMVGDPNALPHSLKSALIRNLKMVYRMRDALREAFEESPDSLISALNLVWPEPSGGSSRQSSSLNFLPRPNEWWVLLVVDATRQSVQQTVHYHLLEGYLLIDGKPLGKLPPEHRQSVILTELFGNRSLSTYPSALPGMTYVLGFRECGHQIHLGFRKRELIVRACINDRVLEFVPRKVFIGPSNFDLPASLIKNCVHWIDVNTGMMEVRRQPDKWVSKEKNLFLNFNTRLAWRRGSHLVDTQSRLFQRVVSIFDHFEYGNHLTVYQKRQGDLYVELSRLDLTFWVNAKGLLQSSQLRSEIDTNQDAGTWYGLTSKLILKDTTNPRQRSIIVPLGGLTYKRSGLHVTLNVGNSGEYGRFMINDVLGRLDCHAEPRLLYLKAQFHAYTSFVVPDSLTGRTGTEEAVHCLKSGYCQPWTPLNTGPVQILKLIANLAPNREYYPKDMKVMQVVSWNPNLTASIQNEAFRSIIQEIRGKSERLSLFAFEKINLDPDESGGDQHLSNRSYLRRRLYQRPAPEEFGLEGPRNLTYHARDRCRASQSLLNVSESVSIIRDWPSKLPTPANLARILQDWPNIGGYDRSFDRVLLSDCLDIQFAADWGALVNLCLASNSEDKYALMFLFAAISFNDDTNMEVIRTLIAFAVLEDLKKLLPPKHVSYDQFRHSGIPHAHYISQLVRPFCTPYTDEEQRLLEFHPAPRQRKKLDQAKRAHEQQIEDDCTAFADFLLKQWPCSEPGLGGFSRSVLIDVTEALQAIRPEWLRLFQNMELSVYIQKVQHVLDLRRIERENEMPISRVKDEEIAIQCPRVELPTLAGDLFRKIGPLTSAESHLDVFSQKKENTSLVIRVNVLAASQKKSADNEQAVLSPEISELESIVNGMVKSQSFVRQQYGQDMMQSLRALQKLKSVSKKKTDSLSPLELSSRIKKARQTTKEHFDQLSKAFETQDSRVQWLEEGGLWPCITPISLLEQLRSTSACFFGERMKESLLLYAMSITTFQRLLRIEDALRRKDIQKAVDEQENVGHKCWLPSEYPDWLLLEIDANILIRQDQIDVARATIHPASGSNSVLQMNMGQGKTSCIMPMVAAVLADTKNLQRLVIPKSLLFQTAQLLQARLGGLLGRELRHIPFSRKTSTNSEIMRVFYMLHLEILKSSGVILALPEHNLSFMLSGLQKLSDSCLPEARQMVKVEAWLRGVSRDVLDECDVTLAVRTQLIYPSGTQSILDGHPHRWETAEALLGLVHGHLWNLQQKFPHSLEVIWRPHGGFPMIFFLRKDVEDALIAKLVDDIYNGGTSMVAIEDLTRSDRLAIKSFISEAKIQQDVAERIRCIFPDKPAARQNIYLLRGLLVHRILLLTLKKRWNVQYGLSPNRIPVAVPFHAKGLPSEQGEWGHPDVAILFTCLAFYYQGVSRLQLRQSLEHVLKSDDPLSEYDRWTYSSKSLPDSLREWTSINVDDEAQLGEIWGHLHNNAVVIDFFLNTFVFPKHARQFRIKLQASGWDVPLLAQDKQSPKLSGKSQAGGKFSRHTLTTGFSGTNDNRRMLPLTIKQEDLPGLSHTNAEVLTYLLQSRNRKYELAADNAGKHLSEIDLLRRLKKMNIRILIDSGAQILEMDNRSLVTKWLIECPDAPAAIFFDDASKPSVLFKNGHEIPLLASTFAEDLSECLVYLDQAHTRGTDLKMPAYARGALTLGLDQTKDHTVQAAMRLRQLATTQSVVFFAPPEVHQSILDLRKKHAGDAVDSYDVICWLLEQTCDGIEQLQPLYISQGFDFCQRTQAATDNSDFLTDITQREAYLSTLRQNETQTLRQLYEPKIKSMPAKNIASFASEIAGYMKELKSQRKNFQDTGTAVHGSALQEVEQEREVAFEVEAVREIQKPTVFSPLSFSGLHRDIINFVKTGNLVAGSLEYEKAFVALRRTALGRKHGIESKATTSKLYVSREFTRTVLLPQGRSHDQFQRQVSWILWSCVTEIALIIIPEEAELILPLVRDTKMLGTHLLTYAAPVTRKMLHFNRLDYYSVPSLPNRWKAPKRLKTDLGIFAGRLYFDYEEYRDLGEYLAFAEDSEKLATMAIGSLKPFMLDGSGESVEDAADEHKGEKNAVQVPSFTARPLTFLKDWLALRRKGQDFVHTPMGYICQGKALTASHPFFTKVESEVPSDTSGTEEEQENAVTWSTDTETPDDESDRQ